MIFNTRGIWFEIMLFAAACVMQVIEGITYVRLLRDAKELPHCKSQILKQIKMKYESLCRIGKTINNTRNFVDKSLYSVKICGLETELYTFLRKVINVMCIITATILAVKVYIRMGEYKLCMEYMCVGFLAFISVKLLEELNCVERTKKKISIIMTDYLENQLYASLVSENKYRQGEITDSYEIREIAATDETVIKEQGDTDMPEEEIIKSIIEEYL